MNIVELRQLRTLVQDSGKRLEECRHVHRCHDILPKLYEVESAIESEIHEQEIAESEKVIHGTSKKVCCHHLCVTTSTEPPRCVNCHSPVCAAFISNGIVCQLDPAHRGVHEALIVHYKPRPSAQTEATDESRRRETLEWLRDSENADRKAVSA